MTGNSVALDTNQAINVLNDVPAVVAWLNTFDRLYLPATVVGELLYGALNSAKSAENLSKIDALVATCLVLDTTVRTGGTYAQLRLALKKKGRPVPENDLWIAAACVEHQLPLATDDDHFSAVALLTTVKHP